VSNAPDSTPPRIGLKLEPGVVPLELHINGETRPPMTLSEPRHVHRSFAGSEKFEILVEPTGTKKHIGRRPAKPE